MAVKYKDYYEVLGVHRGATEDQIRNAYRTLARKNHPDVNPNDKGAEERFKEINEAYSVLSDSKKRQQYDALGPNWREGAEFRPPPGWSRDVQFDFGEGGDRLGGFSDFFENLFGGRTGAGPSRTRARAMAEATMPVSLEEAHRGTARTVSIRGGDGRVNSVQVQIPPGASDGEVHRVQYEGGDLLVTVKINPHPLFRIIGSSDLELDLPVLPWEAALGTRTRIPTLEGPAEITVPPTSQTDRRLRMRGQGLHRKAGGRGDQYVRIKIVNPPSLNARQRHLYEQLAAETSFDPRPTLWSRR